MKQPLGLSGKRLARAGLIAFGLLFSSFALADIISGNTATNSSSHATYTLLTINEPASVAPGDLLLANIDVNGGTPANVTPPAGWTQILRTDNDTNISMISYWKLAGASEPANYTWTIDTQTRAEGGITQYSGVDPINPIDASAGNSGLGKVATTSSVTTSAPNEEVVALYGFDAGNSTSGYFSVPTGMTEKYDVTHIPLGPSTAADDAVQVTSGASGSKSSTITGNKNRNWVSQAIALRMTAPTTLTNGIIAYWKLDGSSVDATGNGHNGSDTGITYSTSDGIVGQGAHFSSAFNSVITIPDNAALKPTGSFTVNAWVKTTTHGGGLFQAFSQTPNAAGYAVYFGQPSSLFLLGKNTGTTRDTDFKYIFGQANSVIDGNWHMVTSVYDGSNMYLYQDGTLVDSAAWSGVAYASTTYITIGENSSTGTNDNPWDGSEDEVGVWNRALTTAEIAQLYNSGSGKQYPF